MLLEYVHRQNQPRLHRFKCIALNSLFWNVQFDKYYTTYYIKLMRYFFLGYKLR